ncbi:MAG: tyrosine-protein phosphatase [Clostridia bacterium]|nr:tyrosine-protein phosphatase [Clostridia bacterium]
MNITLISPPDGAVVSQMTEGQRAFSAGVHVPEAKSFDYHHPERTDGKDDSFPSPVILRFAGDADTVLLSESPDFENAKVLPAENGEAKITNLLLDTTYYWRADDSEVFSFRTEAQAPRWICAEGLTNIRDLGGWKTMDGRTVRQGCIYRGSELDTHCTVTENGLRTLRGELGIRFDLDLRGEAVGKITHTAMGEDVGFALIPAVAYGDTFKAENIPNLLAQLEILSDPANYPVYFHCWGGADRTGCIAFLIEAVLGVPEEDLLADYELTSLSVWGGRSRTSELFLAFLEGLRNCGEAGDSLNTLCERFLFSIAGDDHLIRRFRENLLL